MPSEGRAAALTLLGALLVGACGGGHSKSATGATGTSLQVLAPVKLPLAPPSSGCRGASRIAPDGERIPATIGVRQGQVGVSVNVCIDGKGPFPFLVDTGASASAVDTALARKLGLPAVGRQKVIPGVGCTTHARERSVASWSVAGFPLAPQNLLSFTGPGIGRPGAPVGLLGSDVWSRFGQLRVDFRRGDLVVPAREGPPPLHRTLAFGATTAPLPRFLVTRPAVIETSLAAAKTPRGAALVVGIAFGHAGPLPFLVDTGATTSLVRASVAAQAGLRPLNQADTQATICSLATARRVLSGAWFIAAPSPGTHVLSRHALHPQVLDEASLGLVPGGLFGSDQMSRFGSVVLDYAGGRVFLGAG